MSWPSPIGEKTQTASHIAASASDIAAAGAFGVSWLSHTSGPCMWCPEMKHRTPARLQAALGIVQPAGYTCFGYSSRRFCHDSDLFWVLRGFQVQIVSNSRERSDLRGWTSACIRQREKSVRVLMYESCRRNRARLETSQFRRTKGWTVVTAES